MKAGKMASSLLAGVLAASMLVTAVPSAAFADSTASSADSSASQSVAASSDTAGASSTDSSVTASASVSSDSSAASNSSASTDSSSSSTKQLTAEETEKFASKRLIVSTDDAAKVTDGDVLASYGDVYLLQYDTEEAASEAYDYYKSWAKLVDVDTAVSVAADATTTDPTDTVMTESDNPLTALQDTADTGTSGQGMIALIDTGASLGGNVTNAVSMLGGDAADDNGHGTEMVKDITSQNPDAKILSIKAIGADGKGDLSAVYAAIEYAIEQKVSYINLSITAWKAEANSILTDAVAEAENAGITVIGAAGNDGLDASNFVPGSIDQVITVGACDSEGIIRTFSNFGSSVDYYADADSTSDAAATVTGYLSKHGMAALGNAKPLIFAAKDATGSSTYVIPDGATDGPELNEVVSFYEDDGSGKYDIGIQDYLDRRQMKSKIVNGMIQAPVVFSRLDLSMLTGLGVYTGFMDPEKETEITSECRYDANTGLVYIPEKYKDASLTVRYYMSDKSQMYDYMFTDISGETFTIANDSRGDFDKSAATIASEYLDSVSGEYFVSEGHVGFYNSTEDIRMIKPGDIFRVQNGQTAISTANLNANAIYEMNIVNRADPRNTKGVKFGHSKGENIFLNHFTRVDWNNPDSSPNTECKALERLGETGNGTLKVATNRQEALSGNLRSYNQIDGWLVGYCCKGNLGGHIPYWTEGRIKCIRKVTNTDGSVVEYFYYQMFSGTAQDNGGIFALKYTPTKVKGRVAFQLQKVDENGNKVAEAGFKFDVYMKQGVSTSTNISDYTYVGPAPTDSRGLAGIGTGGIGTAAETYAQWKQLPENQTWTFLIKETAVPSSGKYKLNDPNNPVLVTINLANTKQDSKDESQYWANGTATFTANKNKGYWKDGTLYFADPENKQPVKGSVAIILQKSDAETDKDVDISGFTFDVYYAAGKLTTTDKSKYKKLGTGLKTDERGQIGILASNIGTEADTYADWVKANPEWTFLIEETAVPEGSGYELSKTPATVTVETSDADVDGTKHIYYLNHMFYFKNIPIVKKVRGEVGLHLQKQDGTTGKDVELSGFTFDVYYTKGSTTSTDEGTYTYLGSMTTDSKGQAQIKTGKVGTEELSYDDWVKNNKTWTFMVEETSVPASSGYALNNTPMVTTVDVSKATADTSVAGLYWLPDTLNFKNTKPHTKTPTIKTTATSSGSHDVMLNEKTLNTTTVTISDVIDLADLEKNTTYTIKGELHNAATGDKITSAKATDITFTADAETATKTMTFTIPAKDVANVKTVVYEYLYSQGKSRPDAWETDATETAQTVSFTTSKLATTAKSGTTGTQQADALSAKETVVDTVKYSGLIPGKSYTVSGTLMDKSTGKALTQNGKTITASKTFTPDKADGTVDVTFTFDATILTGKSVVAFEKLTYEGNEIASHEDISDTDQTVYVPKIGTTAVSKTTGDHMASALEKTATLVDTVKYTNLIPGKSYTVSGKLMDKSTGKTLTQNGKEVTASKTFTPDKADGTVDVTFTFDATQLSGKSVVVFERASYGGKDIASHENLTDTNQTVYVPKIGTTAVSKATGEHMESALEKTATLVDTVKYTNLIPGKSYTVSGTLMDKSTGKALTQNGKTITASTTFTPSKADGTVDVTFTYDATQLSGQSVVAFEKVSYNGTDIASHEDISDTDQTVYIPKIGTTAVSKTTGNHTASALEKTATLVDTVKYTNLVPGKSYTVSGTLMDKSTGKALTQNGKTVTASKTFTPDKADGTVDVTFTYDATQLAGQSVVAFEKVSYNGTDIASHEDINDTDQTVYVPSIGTTAKGGSTGTDFALAVKGETIVDTVKYTNLMAGSSYTLHGVLMDKATGKEVLASDKDVTFTVPKSMDGSLTKDGTADVTFTISDVSKVEGKTLVAFEYLTESGKTNRIASHEDLKDTAQTVYIPSVHTTAVSAKTLEHAQFGEKGMTITDKVDMTGLKTGETYIVRGTLMSRATGKAVTVDSKSVTADSGTFTADKAAMTKNISFTFDGSSLEGDTVVAFEKLYVVRNGKETEVGRHEDITDSNQSVTLTVHGPVLKAGGHGTYAFYIAGAAVILAAAVLLILRKKKRG